MLDGFTGESLAPDSFERKVHEKNHLVTKSGEAPINPSIGRLLKFNGFLKCPTNLELIILADEPDNSVVRQYAANIERGFRNYGFQGKVISQSFDAGLRMPQKNLSKHSVGLIALSGNRGSALHPKELAVMEHLDRCGVPYRMFSMNNSELFWSSLDQVGDWQMLAGGIPYRMNFNWPKGRPIYSVGVMLGIPFMLEIVSWLFL